MTFPRLVGVLTPELVCFHEAGHIATAMMIGASVKAVGREPVVAINGFRCRHHRAQIADVRRHFVNLTVPLDPHFGPNATGQIVCYRQSDR
jgi:hypothetical protein